MMTQEEWAARVAAIGKLAGRDAQFVAENQRFPRNIWHALNTLTEDMWDCDDGETSPAVIREIEKLAADWLAAKGVVAERVCRWEYDDTECVWSGACGVAWELNAPSPAESGVCHCPRCGGKIEVTNGSHD